MTAAASKQDTGPTMRQAEDDRYSGGLEHRMRGCANANCRKLLDRGLVQSVDTSVGHGRGRVGGRPWWRGQVAAVMVKMGYPEARWVDTG